MKYYTAYVAVICLFFTVFTFGLTANLSFKNDMAICELSHSHDVCFNTLKR